MILEQNKDTGSTTHPFSSFSYPDKTADSALSAAKNAESLGNTQIAFSVSDRRSERWALRDTLHKVSSLPRVRQCGRIPVAPLVSLKEGSAGHGSGYGGLSTCGSLWSCPVCSAKIAAHRRGELEKAVRTAVDNDYVVSMLTLTQRHHKGQELGELWDSLSFAWNRVTSARKWQVLKEQLGFQGYIRATEVTHGKAGWHVHTHVLIISRRSPIDTPLVYQPKQGRRRTPYPVEVVTPAEFIADRWKTALAKKNVDFLPSRGGLDWQIVKKGTEEIVGGYIAKLGGGISSISSEVTLGGFKKARRGNRTPFQILADFQETGDMDDLALWHVWEQSSHRKRALTWSKGLRDFAGVDELTDEEIAEEDIGGDSIAYFTKMGWKKLRANSPVELLNVLDSQGKDAAYLWLEQRNIPFLLSPDDYSPD